MKYFLSCSSHRNNRTFFYARWGQHFKLNIINGVPHKIESIFRIQALDRLREKNINEPIEGNRNYWSVCLFHFSVHHIRIHIHFLCASISGNRHCFTNDYYVMYDTQVGKYIYRQSNGECVRNHTFVNHLNELL